MREFQMLDLSMYVYVKGPRGTQKPFWARHLEAVDPRGEYVPSSTVTSPMPPDNVQLGLAQMLDGRLDVETKLKVIGEGWTAVEDVMPDGEDWTEVCEFRILRAVKDLDAVPEGPSIVKILDSREQGLEVKVEFASGAVGWRDLSVVRRSVPAAS